MFDLRADVAGSRQPCCRPPWRDIRLSPRIASRLTRREREVGELAAGGD
jgi:hypothetical protein